MSLLHSGSDTEIGLIDAMSHIFSYNQYQANFADDCAYFQNKYTQCLSMDAICEGVHFDRNWDTLQQIGAQAAIVNLSDIAASAGQAHHLLWSLSIPPHMSRHEVLELARGFASVAQQYNVQVLGGNICIRSGPLEIHVTVLGDMTTSPITRSSVLDGDILYVTGTLGDRALGYLYPSKATRQVRHQWYPHLNEAAQLRAWGQVHAMMDISDGLVQECHRLADLNQINIHLISELIPLSAFYQSICADHIHAAISGGEDYVLLFTAPKESKLPMNLIAYPVGYAEQSSTVNVYLDKEKISNQGYLHQLHPHFLRK